MKRSPIWDQLAHTPILDVIAVEHDHSKGHVKGSTWRCSMNQTLIANARVYGFRLRVFHDGNELYVVKLPSARECECGEYETDHEGGTGYCHFNVAPKDQPLRTTDICHGGQNCLRFRPTGVHHEHSEPRP